MTNSRQVSWWPVHEFLAAALAQANAGPLPMAGTPSWAALADDDPTKLLALAVAGEHAVLSWETRQQAVCDAGSAISAAADWSAVARSNLRHANAVRSGAYIPRSKETA